MRVGRLMMALSIFNDVCCIFDAGFSYRSNSRLLCIDKEHLGATCNQRYPFQMQSNFSNKENFYDLF